MVKILVSLLLMIGTPAFAEEVMPAPVEAYVPPAEASEGVGGWAVVDPVTNQVHGVVVCDISVCGPDGSWGGVLQGEYMGCTNCNLRFQTRATADGNVAGYSGPEVTWNEPEDNFVIESQSTSSDGVTTKSKKKLNPSLTATDGVNLETGIQDIETTKETSEVKVETTQDNIQDVSQIVKVSYINWKVMQYENKTALLENIDNYVNAQLALEGYQFEDEEAGVEESPFVTKIKELTSQVKTFIGDIFNG